MTMIERVVQEPKVTFLHVSSVNSPDRTDHRYQQIVTEKSTR